MLSLAPWASAGSIVFVDQAASPGGDGSSWRLAFTHLSDALDAARTAGDVMEIRIAQGTYRPDQSGANPAGTGDQEAVFELIAGAAHVGGYAGLTAGTDPDERDPSLYPTILFGDLGDDDILLEPPFSPLNQFDNTLTIARATDTPEGTTLDGVRVWQAGGLTGQPGQGSAVQVLGGHLAITDCDLRNNGAGNGAAVFGEGATVTLTGCHFQQNGGGAGGAAALLACDVEIIGCTFNGNVAGSLGGAVALSNSIATFAGSEFSGNIAGIFAGGAVSNQDSSLEIDGCTFTENDALEWGGAIYNAGGTLSITGSHFEANIASADGFGGGITNVNGESGPGILLVADSTFLENDTTNIGGSILETSDGGSTTIVGCHFEGGFAALGGAIFNFNDTAVIGCDFVANEALVGGGAIASTGPALSLVNCRLHGNGTISEVANTNAGALAITFLEGLPHDVQVIGCSFSANHAFDSGGAIWAATNDGGTIDIVNSSFGGNAAGAGGSLFVPAFSSGVVRVTNSTMWGESPSPVSGIVQVSSSALEGGAPGEGNSGEDPLFVDPTGPDMVAGTLDDDLSLSPGSPAIDAGVNAAVPADAFDIDGDGDTGEPLPSDLAGSARIVLGNPDSGPIGGPLGPTATVDMGAYEFQPPPACPGDATGDGMIDSVDLNNLLGAFGDVTGPGEPTHPADFDADGDVDSTDLNIVLAAFGTPC